MKKSSCTVSAALMIGAGFSKNADQNFPDWNTLGEAFYNKVHHEEKDSSQKKFLNVLRLAEEVEAQFGRATLDQILLNMIPENQSTPSDLHTEILELSWSDVFTTNYDTLLERAAERILERNYETVITKEQLVYSQKPRIIKLHGSFNSNRPFIISEEDYRTYPQKFAPFVNTVQQTLLENILCLIGFSGDDPNFLNWIGWIRDNLGETYSSKIYLIGLNDYTKAQESLLAKRNIIIVNLFNVVDKNVDNKHLYAITKFIRKLSEVSKGKDPYSWPFNNSFNPIKNSKNTSEVQNEIIAITKKWEQDRKSYPGWVIAPKLIRQKIWSRTELCLRENIDYSKIAPDILFEYFFELVWRMELCLLHCFDDLPSELHKVLAKIKKEEYKTNLKYHSLLLHLLKCYRRDGDRKKYIIIKKTAHRLKKHMSDDNYDLYYYENIKHYISQFNYIKSERLTYQWNIKNKLSIFEVCKCGLLAEFGEINKAKSLLEQNIYFVRRELNASEKKTDHYLMSLESYIILQLKYVKKEYEFFTEIKCHQNKTSKKYNVSSITDNADDKKDNNKERLLDKPKNDHEQEYNLDSKERLFYKPKNDHEQGCNLDSNESCKHPRVPTEEMLSERLRILKQYLCDPEQEFDELPSSLGAEYRTPKNQQTTKDFIFGQYNTTKRFCGFNKEIIQSIQLISLYEDVGLPLSLTFCNYSSSAITKCLKRICFYNINWAIAIAVNLHNKKAIDKVFTRKAIYPIANNIANELINKIVKVIGYHIKKLQILPRKEKSSIDRHTNVINTCVSLLIRLVSRASSHAILQIFSLIQFVYSFEHRSVFHDIGKLLQETIKCLSSQEQFKLIPEFLKINFAQDYFVNQFPNPFNFIRIYLEEIDNTTITIPPETIQENLNMLTVDKNPFSQRHWAMTILSNLYELKLLNNEQQKIFSQNLWKLTNEFGMPKETGYIASYMHKLPSPKNINTSKLLKAYISNFTFNKIRDVIKFTEFTKYKWTDHDLKLFMRTCIDWLNDNKQQFQNKKEAFFSAWFLPDLQKKYENIIELITSVFIPSIHTKKKSSKSYGIFIELIKLMQTCKIEGYKNRESVIFDFCFNSAISSKTQSLLEKSLVSNSEDEVFDSLEAIDILLRLHLKKSKENIDELLFCIVCKVFNYNHTGITSSINFLTRMFIEYPELISKKLFIKICNSLSVLMEKTEYNENTSDSEASTIFYIRYCSIYLAYRAYKYALRMDFDIHEELTKWKELSQNDREFNDIKARWGKL